MTIGSRGAGPLRVVFYISGHGFGHAARDIQIINALGRLEPGSNILIRTSVPEWFLRSSLEHPAEIAPCDVDTGMVQPDGLSIDEDESARRAAAFYRDFPQRVAVEREWLRQTDPSVVIGDIPPLAFAAAAAVGVPSIAVSNFTWDWIYAAYPAFDAHAPGVRRLIADADAQATLALRLPFPGGFASMPRVEDVPLVARTASVPREDVRVRLGLGSDRPLVLATFGGHGRSVPLDVAASDGRFTVVATDYEVGSGASAHPNLRVVSADDLRRAALSYTDLLAACDVVATKLGYGIVSECLANGVPLLYTLRGRFPEQDVFIREMPAVMRSQMIDAGDLRAGRWASAIEALLAQPEPTQAVRCDGAQVVAHRVLAEVGREMRVPQFCGLAPESNREPGSGTARDLVLVTAVYSALAILFTWPLPLRLGSVVASDLGDPLFNAWVLAWDASRMLAALHGNLAALAHYWDANIFFPHPYALAYSDHQTVQALRILPVYAATHNPILAYNINFLLTYVLSGVGMFLLVRELTGNRRAAFVAGLAFAFAPFRAGSIAHAQVLSSEWMPFTLFGLSRFFRTGRTRALAGGAVAWLLQNLSCGYYLLFFSPFVPLYAAWELTRRGLWRSPRVVGTVGAALAGAALLTVPFVLPYQKLRTLGFEPRPLWEVQAFSADLLSFVTADPSVRLWGNIMRAWPRDEAWLFPGLTIVGLAVLACVLAWRNTRAGDTRRPTTVRVLGWLTLALAGVALAQLFGWSLDVQIGPVPLKVSRIERTLALFAVTASALLALAPQLRARLGAFVRTPSAVFALIALLSAALALGPTIRVHGDEVATGPYLWLYTWVPGWDGLRVAARFGMLVALALAALAGLGLARIDARRRGGLVVAAAGIAILVESAAFPIRINGEDELYARAGFDTTLPGMVDASRVAPIYGRVAELPEPAVLAELPLGDPFTDIGYMIASTRHWRRLVNGYSGGFPADYALLQVALKDPTANPDLAASTLRRSGATHVVLHEAAYPGDRGAQVAEWLRSVGAREIAHDGPDRLYALAGPQ